MHIKDYSTYPKNIELKECQIKDPKILLRIVRGTYNNILNILKNNPK